MTCPRLAWPKDQRCGGSGGCLHLGHWGGGTPMPSTVQGTMTKMLGAGRTGFTLVNRLPGS